MTRRSLGAIIAFAAALALVAGLWPYDCRGILRRVDAGRYINLVAVEDHSACSSLLGFTWSYGPIISIIIVVGPVLVVTLATLLLWRRHGRG